MKRRKTLALRELVGWEIKKLCTMPMMYIFVLLCIGFNILMILGSRYGEAYVAYVREARQTTGSQMGVRFQEQAKKLPDSEEKELLLRETEGAEDIFETYDAGKTAQLLISRYRVEGWAADALERKYQKQEQRVQELAAQNAAMDVGAAGMTKELFDLLFLQLCRAVITEGMLLAVFAALYICGCEQMERTWQTVYTSKHGRRVQREKFCAGLLYVLAVYGVTAAVSCGAFAGAWKLGGLWDTNMSTQFYFISSMGMKLPFIPWRNFTMRGYLAAVIALGAVVAAVFYLLGYLAGLLAKNSYIGFTVLFVLGALNFEVVMLAGDRGIWGIYEAALWTPVIFWWSHPLWFSDMGMNAVVPWQECLVGALCMVGAAVLLAWGFRRFYRKDM